MFTGFHRERGAAAPFLFVAEQQMDRAEACSATYDLLRIVLL
jgi:hypothetical protein